jgi:RNA polymerase sigma-70 factor (ECF subfamily)
MMSDRDGAPSFEPHRRHLTGLAYRMLGSLAEAEDIVQEAYLRWHGAERGAIANPRAFLSKTVTRLCLDHVKSARVRREEYVGPWLPEPVLDMTALEPESTSDMAHDLSMALMLALERLSPLERAAFLLHDVFDMEFTEIAPALDRNEAAVRQLAARARAHVRAARPRFAASPEEGARLAEAFLAASRSGDAAAMMQLLTSNAALHSDGGGKKQAALNVIQGADKIAAFFAGIARKRAGELMANVAPARINGLAGYVVSGADGDVYTVAVDVEDGKISAIYIVRNPDKLKHVG